MHPESERFLLLKPSSEPTSTQLALVRYLAANIPRQLTGLWRYSQRSATANPVRSLSTD